MSTPAEEKALMARNLAGELFKAGFNCAESILLAFRELLKLDFPPQTVRLATGLGGGLGYAGCMCGALTASALVLGALKGRTTAVESRDAAYELTRQFHDLFQEKHGNTCCRALNPHPFDSKEHLRNCLKITGGTAKLLMEFLQQKGLA